MSRPADAISYQVSIRGKGVAQLSHQAASELVERTMDGEPPPAGVKVKIQCWRAGRQIDMSLGNHRADILRETFRRLLQAGKVPLEIRRR